MIRNAAKEHFGLCEVSSRSDTCTQEQEKAMATVGAKRTGEVSGMVPSQRAVRKGRCKVSGQSSVLKLRREEANHSSSQAVDRRRRAAWRQIHFASLRHA